LNMRFHGQRKGVTDVNLEGQALPGGGLRMTRSAVTLGPSASPSAYRGKILGLDGTRLVASVSDSAGRRLRLGMALSLDPARNRVTGTLNSRPTGGMS
jgi:hypothetical protein